jgi:hypothetical protein
MNASRRVLRASTNTVKKIYSLGEKSVQGHVIEGTIIVILIVLTAVVLKFLPLKFLCFFNNIIVKVIFLIVIAFVALYCPAIGLMLAILLVSIIQMCQRKQLSLEIDNIQNRGRTVENMPTGDPLGGQVESMDNMGSDQQFESMDNMGGDQQFESMDNMGGDQQFESMGNMGGDQQFESMGNMGSNIIESYGNRGGRMEPQGFNDDTSCVTGCGGSGSGGKRDNRRELNGMCGNVKTWTNQESAQGLDGEVVGLQSSIGYPL